MRTPQQMLRTQGLHAKKSWGQNFLGDDSVLARIASSLGSPPGAGLDAQATIVELGAGMGHLTRHLLATGARVVAVERDRDLVPLLRELGGERLRVVEGNATELEFATVADSPRVFVAGNLPYHLTSPIMFRVLEQRASVAQAVFTVQKEVAVRLAARPGGRDYGLLPALLGLYFDVEGLFDLPAHLFHPRPKVDSRVVRLTALNTPRASVTSDATYRAVVKAAFAQRRKTLFNSLRSNRSLGGEGRLRAALEQAGIDPGRRAETLSCEEFAALERALFASPSGEAA